MKKIILLSLALLILSNNISYSQDVLFRASIGELIEVLEDNDKEIMTIRKDFAAMKKITDNHNELITLNMLIRVAEQYHLVLKYQKYLVLGVPLVDKNQKNIYYGLLKLSLSDSKKYVDLFYRAFIKFYPLLEMTSALHSVDKVKKNMLDTLAKIDTTIGLLSKEIKSKP